MSNFTRNDIKVGNMFFLNPSMEANYNKIFLYITKMSLTHNTIVGNGIFSDYCKLTSAITDKKLCVEWSDDIDNFIEWLNKKNFKMLPKFMVKIIEDNK